MKKDENYYLKKALVEAKKAYKKDEIPVGVIIVQDDKIVAKAYNMRDSLSIVTKHAEIIAIEKANKKINNWRLLNAVLYSTLEPCTMCKEVIKEAKIEKVIYGAKNNKSTTENNYKQIEDKKLRKECEDLIKSKFQELRNK